MNGFGKRGGGRVTERGGGVGLWGFLKEGAGLGLGVSLNEAVWGVTESRCVVGGKRGLGVGVQGVGGGGGGQGVGGGVIGGHN